MHRECFFIKISIVKKSAVLSGTGVYLIENIRSP